MGLGIKVQVWAKVSVQLCVPKTVYSCIVNYSITYFYYNSKPTFASP